MSAPTTATLSAAVANEYELVWTGSNTITINGFGSVTFSQIGLPTAAQICEKFVDGDGNPLYIKKKAAKPIQEPASKAKS